MEKYPKKLKATRLESWALPGVPDVLLCDEHGQFHFIELKVTKGSAVDLRPHQVSWLTTHGEASVWVLVRRLKTKNDDDQIFLYRGRDAIDLRMTGLKNEPLLVCDGPAELDKALDLILSEGAHTLA